MLPRPASSPGDAAKAGANGGRGSVVPCRTGGMSGPAVAANGGAVHDAAAVDGRQQEQPDLEDGYLLDWNLFCRLGARGEQHAAAGAEELRRALELVRGALLLHATVSHHSSDCTPNGWVSLSPLRPGRVAAAVVDTAHRLADLALAAGDSVTARWAIEQGQRACPGRLSDYLWADLVRVNAAEGNGGRTPGAARRGHGRACRRATAMVGQRRPRHGHRRAHTGHPAAGEGPLSRSTDENAIKWCEPDARI